MYLFLQIPAELFTYILNPLIRELNAQLAVI